jgi:hypothetical protein
VTEIIFFCICLNISSIVDTAQVVDTFAGHFVGSSVAMHISGEHQDLRLVHWDPSDVVASSHHLDMENQALQSIRRRHLSLRCCCRVSHHLDMENQALQSIRRRHLSLRCCCRVSHHLDMENQASRSHPRHRCRHHIMSLRCCRRVSHPLHLVNQAWRLSSCPQISCPSSASLSLLVESSWRHPAPHVAPLS